MKPFYNAIEAVTEMGILVTVRTRPNGKRFSLTANRYIRKMIDDGILTTSYKMGKSWVVTSQDVEYVKNMIRLGKYKPRVKNGIAA